MLLRHHSQTKRAESLSCKMLMTLRALPRVRYFIYLNVPVGCVHFFKEEKDLVILPDAFFLHPLVVQDMFNIPRTRMEMEKRPSVFYIVSLCIWKLTCWPSLTAAAGHWMELQGISFMFSTVSSNLPIALILTYLSSPQLLQKKKLWNYGQILL